MKLHKIHCTSILFQHRHTGNHPKTPIASILSTSGALFLDQLHQRQDQTTVCTHDTDTYTHNILHARADVDAYKDAFAPSECMKASVCQRARSRKSINLSEDI